MTVPSVPTVPVPAAPLWRDTPEGRAEEFVRAKLRQMIAHIAACQPPDYDEAVEFMGAEKATKMMHDFEYYGQCCPNHAPCAR